MYIVLKSEECKKIAKAIFEQNSDTREVVVTIANLNLVVNYSLEIDGYYEDDYFNGTGAWVTTSVDFTLHDVKVEGCEDIAISCDSNIIENEVKEYFND